MTDTESGVLDLVLIQAAKQAAAELGGELDVPAEAVRYSRRHRRAMAPLGRHGPGHGRRQAFRWAACIVAAMLVGSAGAAVSVEAVRESIINFIFDPDARGTEVKIIDSPHTSYVGTFVALDYVPSGFECVKSDVYTSTEALFFKNGEQWFSLTLLSGGKAIVDTENAEYEELYINGNEAVYLKKANYNALLFSCGGASYHVDGNIAKKEMLEIAKNIKTL